MLTTAVFSRSNFWQALPASASMLGLVASEVEHLLRKPLRSPRTRAEEAAALRAYVAEFAQDDPRLAEDLYAAAARHEGLS